MKDKNKDVSKNLWKRIIQKKWFFPALYLTIAALMLTGVIWFQNTGQPEDVQQDFEKLADEFTEQVPYDDDVQPVMEQQEVIKMPFTDEEDIEIITKFFDYDADQEEQERALIEYNSRFYQSTGLDFAKADGDTFDIVASLSGTVLEVKDDPLLGQVVILSHDDDVKTYYAKIGRASW